jgi:hypothetical protein
MQKEFEGNHTFEFAFKYTRDRVEMAICTPIYEKLRVKLEIIITDTINFKP